MESTDDTDDESTRNSTEAASDLPTESELIIASYKRRRGRSHREQYEDFRTVVLRYKELHGNTRIPFSFVVPYKSEDWSERLWGLKAGLSAVRVRSGVCFSNHREDLLSIGFDYSHQLTGYRLAKATLLRYKEIFGDMSAPPSFVVPQNDESWPKGASGMKLGSIVNSIRLGLSYTKFYDELLSIGFDYRINAVGFQLAKQALLLYNEIYDDMLVPSEFEVPRDSDIWPADMRGMKLGNLVTDIRQRVVFFDMFDDLLDIGFTF
jgi:hypothetical protein